MAMWQGDAPDPWPGDQPPSSPVNDVAASDLEVVADLVAKAEAVIAGTDPIEDAKAVERLRADQLLVEAVCEEGMGGARHRQLEVELVRYAVPVLKHLLSTGEIVLKCSRLKRSISDAEGLWELTARDRDELAHDMIADAMPIFTTAVFEERRWSPARGASLKTYFVNACAMQFPSLYRQWWNTRRRFQPMGLEIDPDPHGAGAGTDPASAVAVVDEVVRLLRSIDDPQTREVLTLRAIGYSAQSAAVEAGLSEKAAEGRVARFRRKLQKGAQLPRRKTSRKDGGRFR